MKRIPYLCPVHDIIQIRQIGYSRASFLIKLMPIERLQQSRWTHNWLKTEHRVHWLKVKGYTPLAGPR